MLIPKSPTPVFVCALLEQDINNPEVYNAKINFRTKTSFKLINSITCESLIDSYLYRLRNELICNMPKHIEEIKIKHRENI